MLMYMSRSSNAREACILRENPTFSVLFSVSVFLVTLAAFEHLLFSCLAAVAAQAAGIALFNLDVIHALPSVDWNKGERKTGRLFKSTLFLFISAFLDFLCVLSCQVCH